MWPFKRKPFFPSLNWLQEAREETQCTPDIISLERYAFHRIFVCDTLMRNHPNNHKLGIHSAFQWVAVTVQAYELWKVLSSEYGSLILPFKEQTNHCIRAPIRGELFIIPTSDIPALDGCYRNTEQFQRVEIPVKIPAKRVKKYWDVQKKDWIVDTRTWDADKPITAWMYFAKPSFWLPVLERGRKFKYKTKDGQFSLSSLTEYGTMTPIKIYTPHNVELSDYYFLTKGEYDSNNFKSATYTKPRTVF